LRLLRCQWDDGDPHECDCDSAPDHSEGKILIGVKQGKAKMITCSVLRCKTLPAAGPIALTLKVQANDSPPEIGSA